MSIWLRADDFDELSWEGTYACAVCGSIKRPDEERIFRPPTHDDFSGSFDICEGCIREGAKELGLAETAGAQHVINKLTKEVSRISDELSSARDSQASLARENVRLQEVIDDLNAPDELYGLDPEEEDDDE